MVSVGQTAPDFIAPAVVDGETSELELFRLVEDHEAVVLVFSPVDFVPEPTAELVAIETAGWPNREDVAVVAVSADSLYAHDAYADRFDLSMPLVSDRHASVADTYGLRLAEFDTHTDVPARATVVLDRDWTVQHLVQAAPLDRVTPAPVETAAEPLRKLGVGVETPTVTYDL